VPNGQVLAERLILRAALSDGEYTQALAEALTAEAFLDPVCRRVADALLGNNGAGPVADPETVARNPELADAVSELVMAEGPPVDWESFDQSMGFIQLQAKRRRKAELEAEQPRGGYPEEDPRFQELLDLTVELQGSAYGRE
jgi:hypothetical protein